MINFHKVDDEKDYVAYVSRLQKIGVAFDQLLERARHRAYCGRLLRGCRHARCHAPACDRPARRLRRSEEHTSELQSLMRISYAVFCLTNNKYTHPDHHL